MEKLHLKYAPILRYTKGENFYPMRADAVLGYSSLYKKDEATPLVPSGQVTAGDLVRQARSKEVFLRTVDAGPLLGPDVVANWGKQTLDLVYRWAQKSAIVWTEDLARRAYGWFGPQTRGATQLFWWNDLLAPLVKTGDRGSAEDLPRLILPQDTRTAAIERYRSHTRRDPGYTYYYRTIQDGTYLCLQYWFFYSFNDWAGGFGGMNDHEGDWEGMMIFFEVDGFGKAQEPPAYVTFVGHHSRMTKPWRNHDLKMEGTHPVGFVAAGSHATYPEAKPYPIMARYGLVDQALGDGVTIDHDDWEHRILLDDVPWLANFQGSWGTRFWLPLTRFRSIISQLVPLAPLGVLSAAAPREIELPGVSAPHGPMLGDTGQERPQWKKPVAWAEVPES